MSKNCSTLRVMGIAASGPPLTLFSVIKKSSDQVKSDMLEALDTNKDDYLRIFGPIDVERLKKNIESGIDENRKDLPIWFNTPECVQAVCCKHGYILRIYT